MKKLITEPQVFIIESLNPDDEGNGRFEGGVISHILKLHGKLPEYRYVRTKKEFEEAVVQFGASKYRYLHISTHADSKGMCTTNQNEINFDKLASILRPHLKGRRLFFSACSMVNEELAEKIIPTSGCRSIAGPAKDISFTDAAILWPSFYHLMFTDDSDVMKVVKLKEHLKNTSKMFGVSINFFSKLKDKKEFKQWKF